jgi:EAL domain-containing protein (putative c-di-GMP-specific phosphodiesterase class I)/GGDEF domain-containing protein
MFGSNQVQTLATLLHEERLQFVFQPILDLYRSQFIGHEALMRGPDPGPLSSPLALLETARAGGMSLELERTACFMAMQAFAATGLSGKLFLNVSSPTLYSLANADDDVLLRTCMECSLSPGRIVLELNEQERVTDPDALCTAFIALGRLGIQVALDGFGEGRSSLRLWAQLKPVMVKLGHYFVQDIHRDGRKVEILRSLLRMAEALGTPMVAQGVEETGQLAILRDLGCPYAQGHLIARPTALPPSEPCPSIGLVLRSSKIAVVPNTPPRPDLLNDTVDRLLVPVPAVGERVSNEEILRLLIENPSYHALAVVDRGLPIGLINRRVFIEKSAQPFHRELYGRRSCAMYMSPKPMLVERSTPIDALVSVLAGDDQRYLYDGFVITDGGRYAGLATGESLVKAVTERRIEAARHANPLTFLPGNIPITEHIRRLLKNGEAFSAVYFDLNNFKPYNDLYGYWRGDEMIKLAASVLTESAEPGHDFVGHVGGDDFVVLLQSDDWQIRCRHMISSFNLRAQSLFDEREIAQGGMTGEDRRGFRTFFPLTSISAGAVRILPGAYIRPEEVASAAASAKKEAKARSDGFFILEPSVPGSSGPQPPPHLHAHMDSTSGRYSVNPAYPG